MKTTTWLLGIVFLSFVPCLAQCPSVPLLLTTQDDIDNFAANYPGCTLLTHELRVNGENSNITNLNGLSGITQAQNLFILHTEITDFLGLENLESAGYFSIGYNHNIVNLDGLGGLQDAEELVMWFNSNLIDLSGLTNFQSAESIDLFQNFSLEDISSFENLQTLTSLSIAGNELHSLSGLENLHTINGDVFIANESMSNFNELSNLTAINGSLFIYNHPQLVDISAFQNLQSLDDLVIADCPLLKDFTGLENIQNVSGTLRVGFNPLMTDLSIFQNVTTVGTLDVYENANLENLSGLENIETVYNNVYILNNPILNDISAIAMISPSEVNELVIAQNPNLSICDNDFVCSVVFDSAIPETIESNAVGCSSSPQVAASCLLASGDFESDRDIVIFPNPVSEKLFLSIREQIALQKVTVFSSLGSRLMESSAPILDFSHLLSGVYFVEILTDQGTSIKQVVKE